MQNRNDKIETNRRNGGDSKKLKATSLADIREPETAVDRQTALPSYQPRKVAPSPMATSANAKGTDTMQPSSPLRNGGPLKIKQTGGEFESDPSFSVAAQRTFGTADGHLMGELFAQVTRALPNVEPHDPQGNHALAALHGIGPQDTLEGMLSAQMVAGHNLIMEFMARARMKEQSPEGVERYMNLATKQQRTYVVQMEALDRHRGKGEQKMNVEHVHVHDGAQAVVGPVSQRGNLDASEENHEKSNRRDAEVANRLVEKWQSAG